MRDDPQRIADHLIGEHGLDGARRAAMDGLLAAQADGDNYRLSVWREVRNLLRARREVSPAEE